ncbi:peptidyl-prolyl cis-trans isomerase [Corynespora cassiicola Philippines]|uniref:peptidylprolyl isomerase n=1 Tax=Corynespora cassiicola Philippines TaxID=1448308 RepID=A0A2T2MZS5_CORCC|nr:peptidyl-prolyl cis-trans isomerase [Corynespora cassiicola Philippines]
MGNGVDVPKKHDEVSMEYTGTHMFDSSVGRGDLITPIGVGRFIRGWDEGILGSDSSSPMTLGEKATLTISADYGYGARGFPGHIPANARLIL